MGCGAEFDQRTKTVFPFGDFDPLAHGNVLEGLAQATGPVNLQAVDLLLATETEVNNPGIIAAETVAAIHPLKDFALVGQCRNFSADGVAIRARADQPNLEGVIAGA